MTTQTRTQTETQTEKERALALLHSAIEHNVLISKDNCVAVIISHENGEEGWYWLPIEDAAEDIVKQNSFEVLEEGIRNAKAAKQNPFEAIEEDFKKKSAERLIEQCFEEGILWEKDGKVFSPWFQYIEGEEIAWPSRESLLNDLLSQETWLDDIEYKYNPRSEEYLRKWYEAFAKTRDTFSELHEMLFGDKDPTLVFSEEPDYHYAYYFNPNSNAGGQIVECPFDDGMARLIKKGEDFIEVVAERTQYLSDINTCHFFNTVDDLIESKEEMYIGSVVSEDNWKDVLREVA